MRIEARGKNRSKAGKKCEGDTPKTIESRHKRQGTYPQGLHPSPRREAARGKRRSRSALVPSRIVRRTGQPTEKSILIRTTGQPSRACCLLPEASWQDQHAGVGSRFLASDGGRECPVK